jgi:hypothetical protein
MALASATGPPPVILQRSNDGSHTRIPATYADLRSAESRGSAFTMLRKDRPRPLPSFAACPQPIFWTFRLRRRASGCVCSSSAPLTRSRARAHPRAPLPASRASGPLSVPGRRLVADGARVQGAVCVSSGHEVWTGVGPGRCGAFVCSWGTRIGNSGLQHLPGDSPSNPSNPCKSA